MTSSRSRVLGLVLLAAAFTMARAARAACPQVTCDCLGQAAQYSIVAAEKVSFSWGTYRSEGSTLYSDSSAGEVCATTATLKGISAGPDGGGLADVGTLVAVAGPGAQAVRASSRGDVNVFLGLLVTGGGAFVGADQAEVQALDTSGTHAQVAACTQAMADAQAGSQMLAALTPTLDYGDIVLTGDEELEINVGAGVNVIRANKVILRASPISYPPVLRINTVPETESVIINTDELSAGYASIVEGGPTMINVPGRGPSVRLNKYSGVRVPVLAPERIVKLTVPFAGTTSLYGRRVFVRGGNVGTPFCL